MDINDIDAVLNLAGTLEAHHEEDASHNPGLLADLFRWADNRASQLAAGHSDDVADKPKAKRGKATEPKDSDTFEASPDPSSDEPDF